MPCIDNITFSMQHTVCSYVSTCNIHVFYDCHVRMTVYDCLCPVTISANVGLFIFLLQYDANLLPSSLLMQGCRKVVLSTNIAETSVTIPGVKYVVDTGVVKARWVELVHACLQWRELHSLSMEYGVSESMMVLSSNYYIRSCECWLSHCQSLLPFLAIPPLEATIP